MSLQQYFRSQSSHTLLFKMPCLKILTNLPISKIPKDFVNNIIPVLVQTVKKDAKVFTVVISGDCHVSFGGDSSLPGAVATLESIGHLGVEENKVISKAVAEFVENELGINRDRFFLSFYDIKGANISKGGVTMALR